ncbi:hypothetical protein TMU01_14710 [Tenuibacillus multivorans]|uniref:Uncharacterized protein n=1 Tax=Tenuibacillus multivorans TaxID=237069 RepID=A0A1G9X440_9BACI|nr:hypothetical protein TMU01_14710 [Tenuibacillus multivorans]SDM91452.1 hypothetical protein SAMN05216498_1004 [Tenuibacillus multivorans]
MTNEEILNPLIKKTKHNEVILAQYMFMYKEGNKYYYKHIDTRQYVVLSKSGRVTRIKNL